MLFFFLQACSLYVLMIGLENHMKNEFLSGYNLANTETNRCLRRPRNRVYLNRQVWHFYPGHGAFVSLQASLYVT